MKADKSPGVQFQFLKADFGHGRYLAQLGIGGGSTGRTVGSVVFRFDRRHRSAARGPRRARLWRLQIRLHTARYQPASISGFFRARFAYFFFIGIDNFLHIRSDLTSILLKTISAICLLSSSWLSPRRPVALSFTLTGLGKK